MGSVALSSGVGGLAGAAAYGASGGRSGVGYAKWAGAGVAIGAGAAATRVYGGNALARATNFVKPGSGDTAWRFQLGNKIKVALHNAHSNGPHDYPHLQIFKGITKSGGRVNWNTISRIRLGR